MSILLFEVATAISRQNLPSLLQASGYTIDFDEWHAFVHGRLPYEKYLKPHPKLRALLDSLPMEKYVFTNADRCHASKCLDLMGIKDCFQGVICFESIMETAHEIGISHHNKPAICKPNRMAFEIALSQAGGASAATTAFFDDSTRNIASAHHIGLFSVLVGRTGVDCASHIQMESMLSLPSHLPWLLQVANDTVPEEFNSVEDGVLAVEKA